MSIIETNPAPQGSSACVPLVGRTIASVEQDLIVETLWRCHGNRTQAAEMLGISVRTIRNKIDQYEAAGVFIPKSSYRPRKKQP